MKFKITRRREAKTAKRARVIWIIRQMRMGLGILTFFFFTTGDSLNFGQVDVNIDKRAKVENLG